jgi:NAD(P)-dependent dehydrogenase (short-subunit alcohol dehydrogenase family)
MDIVSRVAIVTGAGTGIGKATAKRLARGGSAVAIVGRRENLLEETADDIRAAGGAVLVVADDLADPAAPARIVARVLETWDRIDVIVNNAAYIKNYSLDEITVDMFDQHVNTNVRAPMLLVQAALPALRRSPSAAVVNISSSSGSLAIPGQSVYGMTKAAIEYLTKSYASELASSGIRVNCIAPGPVDTPIHLTWARSLEEAYAALKACGPLDRIADPDELARWVEYLASPEEKFVTGAVIPVDAGQTLNGWGSAIGAAAAAPGEGIAAEEVAR